MKMNWLYCLLKIFFVPFFTIFFRTEVHGLENIPKEGGMILAANHKSNWDPPFLGTYLFRPVSYMAKEELFRNKIFAWAIRKCYAFPVKRGAGDRSALKNAVKELKKGYCVGIFPEGTRSKDGKLRAAGSGVSLMAQMANVPVVPSAIIGTEKIFSKKNFLPKLKVIYGKPLFFDRKKKSREDLDEFTKKIMTEIQNMLDKYDKP